MDALKEKACGGCGGSYALTSFPKASRYDRYPETSAGRTSKCRPCLTKANAEWVKKNRQVTRGHQAAYHKRHREERNAQHKREYERDKRKRLQRIREWKLKKCYGITSSDYEMRVLEQGGMCAICKMPPSRQGLGVDHCHKTGKVRGLLCGNCNRAIGLMRDDVQRLEAAISYLLRNG